MDELKKCPNPWCDSHKQDDFQLGEKDVLELASTSVPHFAVEYPICWMCGPAADTPEEAVTAWNTRAALSAALGGENAN